MEEQERLTSFQTLLTEAYFEYVEKHTSAYKRKVGDSEFARWLGVSVGSYNQWINGNRTPDYENAIKLASKLGPEVFDILGFKRVAFSYDPQIIFIADKWRLLDDETKKQIIEHIREETEGGEPAKKNKG
jgi:transcriptional regulator with XRE-family HTH domain